MTEVEIMDPEQQKNIEMKERFSKVLRQSKKKKEEK